MVSPVLYLYNCSATLRTVALDYPPPLGSDESWRIIERGDESRAIELQKSISMVLMAGGREWRVTELADYSELTVQYNLVLYFFHCVSVAVGINLFYICTIVYLFGDLAVYAAAVPKSLRDIVW